MSTTTCSTSVVATDVSLPMIDSSSRIPIDPLDYVESAFDKCIAPNLSAPSPAKHLVRKHVYRKLILDLARQELSIHPPQSIDDVYNLSIHCFARAGLL